MLSGRPLLLKRTELGSTTAILAAVCLPLLFVTIMTLFPVVIGPKSGPLGPVVGALTVALILRQIEPSMRWHTVSLVTFWFVLAAAVGGVCIMAAGTAGLDGLAAGSIGLGVMVLIQGARICWQFQRARCTH